MLSEVTLARPSTFSAARIMLYMQRERERDRNDLSVPLPHFSKQNCSIHCTRNVRCRRESAPVPAIRLIVSRIECLESRNIGLRLISEIISTDFRSCAIPRHLHSSSMQSYRD